MNKPNIADGHGVVHHNDGTDHFGCGACCTRIPTTRATAVRTTREPVTCVKCLAWAFDRKLES